MKQILRYISSIMLVLLMPCASAAQGLTFVEYNCENLFDCRHDTLKEDHEFLPDGSRQWNFSRYWRKLNDISRAIMECGTQTGGSPTLPDFVALVEVENDSTMRMLTRSAALRGAGYHYVMTESEDQRGVDVALLYNPLTTRMVAWHALRIQPPKGHRPTRDILYAKALHRSGDTLHIFVVHAPSRSGGEKFTEPYRMAVAERLTTAMDSIRACSAADSIGRDGIIIAGDFNDYSSDKALRLIASHDMTEVSADARGWHYSRNAAAAHKWKVPQGAEGTYKYQEEWNSLDHIFVSPDLLRHGCSVLIYDAPWLLEEDTQRGYRPRRTYQGPIYHGGVSDHLPLVMKIER